VATKPYSAREISITLERELVNDFGETAFAILRNLLTASPVGNPDNWQNPTSAPPGYVGGHFRRNWLVSIGGFNETEIAGEDSNGAATLAQGRAKIQQFRKLGPNLVIQNNVPYANRLAQGHSLQADPGWVDFEIEKALKFPAGRRELP